MMQGPGQNFAVARVALDAWAEQGRRTVLPVQGFSMWPVLRPGDQVSIRHGGAPPEIGDIVVIRSATRTVAHRVVACRADPAGWRLQTKGDSNPIPDRGWVGADRIVGVVEGVVRSGRPVRRAGISGGLARLLARLSRIQGIVLFPVTRLLGRVPGRMAAANRQEDKA